MSTAKELEINVRRDAEAPLTDQTVRHLLGRPILQTDDSSFTVSTNDRLARVWIRQEERYADCNIVEINRYDGGSSWP